MGTACSEIKEESYVSYAEAERRGAVLRGVVPGCVPDQATSIQAAFDFDTNEQWVHFSLAEPHIDGYERGLQRLDHWSLRETPKTPNWTWWPSELTGVLPLEKLRAEGYRFYTFTLERGSKAVIAVRGTEVFCWCP
jgi:hypothetical protein